MSASAGALLYNIFMMQDSGVILFVSCRAMLGHMSSVMLQKVV